MTVDYLRILFLRLDTSTQVSASLWNKLNIRFSMWYLVDIVTTFPIKRWTYQQYKSHDNETMFHNHIAQLAILLFYKVYFIFKFFERSREDKSVWTE